MTTYTAHPWVPSLALLLGAACLLPGCIDPKSIGQETDGEDGSSSATTSMSETDATTNPTSGQTSNTTDPTGGETDPTGGATDPGPECPPIKPEPCSECECVDGTWNCVDLGCVDSCEGQACGVACLLCPKDEPDCDFPLENGVCTSDGQCVGTPPPKLGFCEGQLQPGFEGDLEVVSGCADMNVYAHDASDERGLAVFIDQGLVADAWASGMPVHVELSATDPAVHIEGRAGILVTEAECNDVIGPDMDIKENWLPLGGTVIVDVIPMGTEQATATVELVDVELYRVQPGPPSITVDFTFTDVNVGWLPG